MRTLTLIQKQVSVTQSQIDFVIDAPTSSDFTLRYTIRGDQGEIVKRGMLKLPIADLDTFNADPADPAALSAALVSIGVEINPVQPLSPSDKMEAKIKAARERQKAKAAQAGANPAQA